jgi:hypothetical protein
MKPAKRVNGKPQSFPAKINTGGLIMISAATYNRNALGKIWDLRQLPEKFPGYRILLQGDPDQTLSIEPDNVDHIDWIAFSEAVQDFQAQESIVPQDAKLGPATLRQLQECLGGPPAPAGILTQLGDMIFRPATVPLCSPPGPPLVGRTPEERSLCTLWNNYGAAIYQQAQDCQLPVETALAVFCVESKIAYNPATGLVIIRFEPAVFKRQAGQSVSYSRGGQQHEWQNLAQAYEVDAEAALLSTSYGLPQLMGFNWQVTPHPSVAAMVLAFQDSCVEQVAGFFGFVENNGLVQYIANADWRGFTKRYNGPGNVDDYSGKLISALKVVNALQKSGAKFVV